MKWWYHLGLELEILKTVDFKKYDIKVLSVEFVSYKQGYFRTSWIEFLVKQNFPQIHDKEGKEAIREYMEKQGYYVRDTITHPNWLANDFIFVKEGF